jgi:ABC-2 type transport system ATP-binding protein
VRANVELGLEIRGMPAPERRDKAQALLLQVGLTDFADVYPHQLSGVMAKRVEIVRMLAIDPEVLLMDEPFTGLDPVNVMLLREAFLELRDRGRTVVFSTHQMEVAEALCESVAIVDRGRMVVGGPLREVRRSSGRRLLRIAVAGDHRLPWLASVPGARVIEAGMHRSSVELDPGTEPEAVLAAAVAAGARILHFEVADPTLEQVFIDHVGHPADDVVHLAPANGEGSADEAGHAERPALVASASAAPDAEGEA